MLLDEVFAEALVLDPVQIEAVGDVGEVVFGLGDPRFHLVI